jgi:hypothetical protein
MRTLFLGAFTLGVELQWDLPVRTEVERRTGVQREAFLARVVDQQGNLLKEFAWTATHPAYQRALERGLVSVQRGEGLVDLQVLRADDWQVDERSLVLYVSVYDPERDRPRRPRRRREFGDWDEVYGSFEEGGELYPRLRLR